MKLVGNTPSLSHRMASSEFPSFVNPQEMIFFGRSGIFCVSLDRQVVANTAHILECRFSEVSPRNQKGTKNVWTIPITRTGAH